MGNMNSHRTPDEFTQSRREAFRDALLGAYADAAEVYDPDRGFNDLLHGLIVYHLAGHRLQRAFEDDPDVRFESFGRGPELRIGQRRIRWNKVGRSSGEQIGSLFPRGSLVAAAMAEDNQQLLLWGEDRSEIDPSNWFLAHIGNPRDGLIRLYLAAPISADGREVTGWASWIPIYDAAQPLADFPEAPAPGLPEPVTFGPLEVSLIDEPHMGDISASEETGSV